MTREEIINEIKCLLSELDNGEDAVSYLTQNDIKWLNETIKVLEQEPCDVSDIYVGEIDCISRQAVLDLIADYDLSMGQVVKGIHDLPSVTPQPKTEHWTLVSEGFPKTERYAFITVYNQTKMCWYQNGVFVDSKQNVYTKENEEFIAWMPLNIPKPYKAESEKINCKTTKCENCKNHNCCDYEPQENEEI